jgi:hypothetical protein
MRDLKRFVGFMVLSMVLISCGSTRNQSAKVVNKVLEDHESNAYEFPAGVYYAYQFDGDKPAYGFDEQLVIEQLASKGIAVKNLWYKAASSSCVPPGSSMAMTVMVEAAMVLQLEEANEQLLEMNFIETSMPSLGSCAYRVNRYMFASK